MAYPDTNVTDLNKLLTQAKGIRSRLEPSWFMSLAFYQSEQWLYYNRGGRLDKPNLDPWRVTLTDNRIIGIVRTEIAKMTKQKPAWQVVPTTAEDADLQAGVTGEKVLDYLWRELHMRNKLMDVLLWSRVASSGFWKVYWDSALGKKVNILADEEGQPVLHAETGAPMKPSDLEEVPEGLQEKTIATGEVAVEVVNPFELYPDPVASEIEDCEWVIQVAVKSGEWVKQRYGVDMEPDTEVAAGPTESRLFPSMTLGGASSYKGIKVHEYWCKPNSKHPDGRQAVWAKDKMLYEGPNPYKNLPYIMFKGIPVPGRFWPTSVTEILRGPQTELNKAKSQVTENAQRIGNPSMVVSKQANLVPSGVPGEVLFYDDTTQNARPEYLQAPQLPQYVVQQQDRAEQSMEAIAAQHEVSNAQVPAGVKAASAINLLQEADDTRLGPAIYDMEEALGEAGSRLLSLVAQYWTDERTIMIAGEENAWASMIFKGAALRENTHVEVQTGSAFPKSKAARQAAIETILGLTFQYEGQQPVNKRMLAKVLRDLEAGDLAKLFGDMSVDESQVNRENLQLAQGLALSINPYDETQVHIESHVDFQRQAAYQLFPPPLKDNFERHVMEHRAQAIQELGPPEQAPEQEQPQNGSKPSTTART